MKNLSKTAVFIIGIITGIIIVKILFLTFFPKQMFVVNESKYGFQETVDSITSSAKRHNWLIPYTYDLQASLHKHDFEVNPVKVFSLCKPEHAYKVLSGEEERVVSALMPCRIAVYEKEGKVFVSMLNSGLFSKFINKTVKQAMSDANQENKEILEGVIK